MTRHYRTNRSMNARINRGWGQTRRHMELNLTRVVIYLMFFPITIPCWLIGLWLDTRRAQAAEQAAATANPYRCRTWEEVQNMTTEQAVTHWVDVSREFEADLADVDYMIHPAVFDRTNEYIHALGRHIRNRDDFEYLSQHGSSWVWDRAYDQGLI